MVIIRTYPDYLVIKLIRQSVDTDNLLLPISSFHQTNMTISSCWQSNITRSLCYLTDKLISGWCFQIVFYIAEHEWKIVFICYLFLAIIKLFPIPAALHSSGISHSHSFLGMSGLFFWLYPKVLNILGTIGSNTTDGLAFLTWEILSMYNQNQHIWEVYYAIA